MSVLGEVFNSLKAMSLLQLLLAFMACIGYALAQGALVGSRGRRYASGLAAVGAIGFAVESSQWMNAAMLLAFAVAGMGMFVAFVWITSRMLGFAGVMPGGLPMEPVDSAEPQSASARARLPQPTEHAHSI